MPLPDPEPGLVIAYTYLWRNEARAGRDSGKQRPSVIVLRSVRADDGLVRVTVVPVTHSPPLDPRVAMELPLPIKRHLGLDDSRSWVVLDEGNRFVWPGHDLVPVPGRPGEFAYGLLPPRFFRLLVDRLRALLRARGIELTNRS